MSKVQVNPGVCGMETTIFVKKSDGGDLAVTLETKCPYIKKMEGDLQEIDGYGECFSSFMESAVYASASKNCKHLACPVPSAIVKALEVESGLALPREVHFSIEK